MLTLKKIKNLTRDENLPFLFILIGLLVILGSAYYYHYWQSVIDNGVKTTATVISTREYWTTDADGDPICFRKILLQYDIYEKEINAPYPAAHKKGIKLPVAYNPKNPLQVTTIDYSHLWLSLIWGCAGALLIVVASMP